MKKKQFSEHFYLVDNVLIDWNPLGVDGPALKEEYLSFIPSLLKLKNDKNKIIEFLRNTLDRKYAVKLQSTRIKSCCG